jgi:hypothetical protein
MSDTFFQVVREDVARNPVARAMAAARMNSALRTFAVQLYTLPDGSQQGANLMAAAQVMAVGMHIALKDSPEWQAMREATDLIVARSDDGFRWHAADAPDIDIGMSAAMQVIERAGYRAVQQAWVQVNAETV